MTMKTSILLIFIVSSIFAINGQNYNVCKKDSLYGVCNEKGTVIIPQLYQSVYPCYSYPNKFVVELKNKFGVIDDKDSVILSVEYEADMKYVNPFVIDGGQAYFDSTATIILKHKGKFGVLNANLKVEIPFEYDFLGYFLNYTAPVYIAKKGKNYMLIDKNQKALSKTDYADFASFYGFSLYRNIYGIFMTTDKKWVFVDESGKEYAKALAKTDYGNDTIAETIEAVRYNGKYAAFTYDGKLIAQGYDNLSSFVAVYPENSMMYSAFDKKHKYGILRSDGVEVVKANYDQIDPVYITGQVCKVSLNGKVGVVDLNTGKEIVPPTYDDIWIFGWLKEVTYAKKNGKCALINNKGQLLTDFNFDDVQTYQDDIYGAEKDGKWGYIDLKGNTVIPFEYDNTEGFFNEKILPLKKNGKYGYINKEGKEITNFKYDKAERFLNKDKAKIVLDGKNGWVDKNGNETWD
jgi:hypothetical protein